MSTYDNLNEEGYLIVKGVLDQNEIDKLKKDLIQNSIDLVFTQNGFDVDANDPESLQLFVDKTNSFPYFLQATIYYYYQK